MNDLARILGLAGLATEQSVAAPADRELKEYGEEGCPCCDGGRCTCPGDCPDCNCHGNNDWDESVEEEAVTEASKDVYAMVSYDYKDDWGSIELVIDNETVEDWNGYFGANETGNPLAAKFVELCKKHGIDPTDVHILSGNDEDIHLIRGRKSGYFDGEKFQWNEAAKPDFLDVDKDGDKKEPMKKALKDKEVKEGSGDAPKHKEEDADDKDWDDAEEMEEMEEMKESEWCGVCGNDTCSCTDTMVESPTMDTTQLVIMMRNAGLSEETITQKLEEWANTPEGVGEVEPTVHGDAYDFAQSVNLSLKRYLDAQDMKVQVTEHKVEDMKALYEAHKAKK